VDKINFSQGMTVLSAAFPDYALKEETVEVYWKFLSEELEDPQFEFAVVEHIRRGKWFPKISELLEVGLELAPDIVFDQECALCHGEGRYPVVGEDLRERYRICKCSKKVWPTNEKQKRLQ
jgi:hypothetical protein